MLSRRKITRFSEIFPTSSSPDPKYIQVFEDYKLLTGGFNLATDYMQVYFI
jgi:hypothetical protein